MRARSVHERDNWRCRKCGTARNVEAHHIVYRSQGGSNDLTNLILLCNRCHAVVHSDKRRWMPVCQRYVQLLAQGQRLMLDQVERFRTDETPQPES